MRFKETELGPLPEDWAVSRIAESCYKPEYGYTASAEQEPVGPRFFRITDIQEQGVDWDSVPYCRCDEDTKRKHQLQPGDLLFARIGATTGKSFLVRRCPDVVYASYLIRVRAKTVDPAFLYYFCNSEMYWRQINASKGDKLKGGVSGSVLAQIRHCLPPLPEQCAIAATLSKLQAAVEVQDKIVATLKELKAATMAKLFREGLCGEPLKKTEIGEIPESWEVVPLGALLRSAQYGLSMRGAPSGLFPILRMNCQQDGQVIFRDLQFVDLGDTAFASFKLCDGDLLFNRTNSFELVGRTAIFHGDQEAVFASYLIRLRVNETSLVPDFLNYYLNLDMVQVALKSLATRGVSQSNISASKLKLFHIPRPSKDEQGQIVVILEQLSKALTVAIQKRDTLKSLFSSMLHLLMTGCVRVSHLNFQGS